MNELRSSRAYSEDMEASVGPEELGEMSMEIDAPARAHPCGSGRGFATGIDGLLGRVMSAEVIPRLVAAANSSRPMPDDALRDRLLRMALRGDRDGACAIGQHCRRKGMDAEVLMQELLAPVADALGRSWEEDRCDFITVTLGMQVLEAVLEDVSAEPEGLAPTGAHRALVAAAPGEQHVFGVRMAAEMLFRAGWHVTRVHTPGRSGLVAAASSAPYDMIGISIANVAALDRLGGLIAEIRRVSLNRDVIVALGGSAVTRNPVAAGRQGADWIAVDGADGVAKAATPAKRDDDA